MFVHRLIILSITAFSLIAIPVVNADYPAPAHGLAMHGDLKYSPDFKNFEYVNPDAEKGGTIRLSAIGGFDSLNPFIVKGNAAGGAAFIYDTLMTSSADEAFSVYGQLAKTVRTPKDRSWVEFTLRDEAR